MDYRLIHRLLTACLRWLQDAWMEAAMFFLSIIAMIISLVLILMAVPFSSESIVNLSVLAMLTFLFALRSRDTRLSRQETLELLERLANSVFVFRSHITFPLTESSLLPSMSYIMEIIPQPRAWVAMVNTSYPISVQDEIPPPGTPEKYIRKRILSVASNTKLPVPGLVENALMDALTNPDPPVWAREWKDLECWSRCYRHEAVSIGVAISGPSLPTFASQRALDAMLFMFAQSVMYSETQLRESRRWANRSETELIRSALIHEQSQELQMLRNILPNEQTRDALISIHETIRAGNEEAATRQITSLIPAFNLYPQASRHLEFAAMYSEQLSQVKDISQDWMHVSLRAMPLHSLLEDLCRSLRRMYPSLSFSFPDRSRHYWVQADTQLRGMIRNILFNAAQASPENGSIRIRMESESPFCLIHIEDDGPGVQDGLEERIFEPRLSLETGKEQNHRFEKHMGLGLFFARYVARAYGGDVRCLPKQAGSGAHFTIRLLQSADQGA